MRLRRLIGRLAFAAGCLALAETVSAQYMVHSWYNFEDGKLPSTLSIGHAGNKENVRIIPFTSQAALAANDPISLTECGRGGMIFTPSIPKKQGILSVFSSATLDRSKLGTTGHALYQADFYLPEEGERMASIAMLAAEPNEKGTLSYAIYRFGILETGQKVFFSFANNTPSPIIYKDEPLKDFKLKRPGWHRFQIIFSGQEDISCAIDGKMTKFSPVKESTLKRLNAGLMATVIKTEASAIADNLSIQWNPEEVPLPDSPWAAGNGVTIAKAPAAAGAHPFDDPKLNWYTDAQKAWAEAKAKEKPLLTMFYAPKIAPYAYLKTVFPDTPDSRAALSNYVLLKLDANQLGPAKLSADYRIARLPTLMFIGRNGQEQDRLVIMNTKTTWPEIEAKLKTNTAPKL